MDGITREQPHGDLFMAEVTYVCQKRCAKRVPLGGVRITASWETRQ